MWNDITHIIIATSVMAAILLALSTFRKHHYKNRTLGSLYFLHATRVTVLLLYIIYILSLFNATSKVLNLVLASSGIVAVFIGIAAQESLGNIIDGFIMVFNPPFEVGDKIKLHNNNVIGTVKSITLRHIKLKTYSNSILVIPNSVVHKDIIENFNMNDPNTRDFINLEVSYECDLRKAIEVIRKCVYDHPLTINKDDITIQVRDYGESGIPIRVSIWTNTVNENFIACSELRVIIKEAFDKEGIEIPYPHVVTIPSS